MGTLIGTELAATRLYWLGQNVALIGSGALMDHYAVALAAQGVVAPMHDAAPLTLAGLQQAYHSQVAQG